MQFSLRTLHFVAVLAGVLFASGPPLITVGRVGNRPVREPNLAFLAIFIVEALGCSIWLSRSNRRQP